MKKLLIFSRSELYFFENLNFVKSFWYEIVSTESKLSSTDTSFLYFQAWSEQTVVITTLIAEIRTWIHNQSFEMQETEAFSLQQKCSCFPYHNSRKCLFDLLLADNVYKTCMSCLQRGKDISETLEETQKISFQTFSIPQSNFPQHNPHCLLCVYSLMRIHYKVVFLSAAFSIKSD